MLFTRALTKGSRVSRGDARPGSCPAVPLAPAAARCLLLKCSERSQDSLEKAVE